MTWDEIQGNWKAVSDKIKLTWGKLSEEDLTSVAGRRDQLVERLQERYGHEQVDTEQKVDRFAQELNLQPEDSKAIHRLNQMHH